MSRAVDRRRALGGVAVVASGIVGALVLLQLMWSLLNGEMVSSPGRPLTVVPLERVEPGADRSTFVVFPDRLDADVPIAPTGSSEEELTAAPGLANVQAWDWHGPTAALAIHGIVLGVSEGTGTCTFVIDGGDERIVAQVPGTVEGNATACAIEITDQRLVGGAWRIGFEYRNAAGESSSATVLVHLS